MCCSFPLLAYILCRKLEDETFFCCMLQQAVKGAENEMGD